KVNGNSVIGYIGAGDKCLLLRADMDGLPMCEESQQSFASQNGNMHACGHDIHTTALLGAAKILKKHEKELKGKIKLLFQPGEETFE
ncbi:M20/M25/M40 family metallo-hydrolase, partial [Desulfovibrio desulfuricans]|nr:M20/M25/M40 family metallo-hydrolase [Desulfovibrio desulfuricans]